jgi:uncharacterized protein
MRRLAFSFAVGLLFGIGLLVSGMTQPAKVVAFLDVAGAWDPSLGFVMAGAIAVHALAYQLVPRLRRPLWAERFGIPTRRDLDGRLLGGAALFGAGWALGGYCPGPALTSVISGASSTLLFTGAMAVGMAAFTAAESALRGAAARRSPSLEASEPERP